MPQNEETPLKRLLKNPDFVWLTEKPSLKWPDDDESLNSHIFATFPRRSASSSASPQNSDAPRQQPSAASPMDGNTLAARPGQQPQPLAIYYTVGKEGVQFYSSMPRITPRRRGRRRPVNGQNLPPGGVPHPPQPQPQGHTPPFRGPLQGPQPQHPAPAQGMYMASPYTQGPQTTPAYGPPINQAYGSSIIQTYGPSIVQTYGQSTNQAYGPSTNQAYGPSIVQASGQSMNPAYGQQARYPQQSPSFVPVQGYGGPQTYGQSPAHAGSVQGPQLEQPVPAQGMYAPGHYTQGSPMNVAQGLPAGYSQKPVVQVYGGFEAYGQSSVVGGTVQYPPQQQFDAGLSVAQYGQPMGNQPAQTGMPGFGSLGSLGHSF